MNVANWITLLRFLVAMSAAVLLRDGHELVWVRTSTALFVLAIVLDKVDGMVARRFDCCSRFGKFFDTALDKIILAVFFLCLTDLNVINRNMVAAALIRDMLTQSFRSYADSLGVSTRTDRLSYTRYIVQCAAVVSGLLFIGIKFTAQADLLRQLSVISFSIGLGLGYWTLFRLVYRHWWQVVAS